jgi:hypothetical protein
MFAINCNGARVLNAESKSQHSSKSAAAFDCAGAKKVSVDSNCEQSRGRPFLSLSFKNGHSTVRPKQKRTAQGPLKNLSP